MVLLSLVVVASLTTLRTTITSSRIDRDHANTFVWLQSASDAVYRSPHAACGGVTAPNRSAVIATYNHIVNDVLQVPKPVIWESNPNAAIAVTAVEFLFRDSFDEPYRWAATGCLEAEGQYTQRVTIRVTTPDGMTKTLQMVKDK